MHLGQSSEVSLQELAVLHDFTKLYCYLRLHITLSLFKLNDLYIMYGDNQFMTKTKILMFLFVSFQKRTLTDGI